MATEHGHASPARCNFQIYSFFSSVLYIMSVENFYKRITTKDDGLRHYPNENELRLKLPLRALIVGPSGSGKTNITMNLLKLIGIWDKVVLLAKNLDEPLYKHLIEAYRKVEKKHKVQILLAITNIKDL